MPLGPILLTLLVVSIYFGLLDALLSRMRLNPRQALVAALAMLLGSAVEVDLAPTLSINLGSGIIPLLLVAWLLATADQWFEPIRAAAAGILTAGAVFLVGRYFPPGQPTELNLFLLDAQYLYGMIAGLVGYTAGRSRRSAFCAGVLGVLLADLTHYAILLINGPPQEIVMHVGGGGFQGTAVVAGVLAVILAELIGEAQEVLQGAPIQPGEGLPTHGGEDGPHG